MPLSDDDSENEYCAACALEEHPKGFRVLDPKGWETWSFHPDGTFRVKEDSGTTYQYIYPYCLCVEMIHFKFMTEDEENLCYACKHLEPED